MGKRCRTCRNAELASARETYLYKESGLPSVVLAGVEVRRCPSCGHHELVIPRANELHRTIAQVVIRKRARLSGAEVRFLRKYLGWSGADFARHVGVGPSTVSNWENDKDPIGPSSDRLLRLMVAHGAPVQDYALDELTKIEDQRTPPIEVRLSPTDRGWASASPASAEADDHTSQVRDRKTVYRMAQSSELPAFKVRGRWRFRRNDVERWIESQVDRAGGPSDKGLVTRRPDEESQRHGA